MHVVLHIPGLKSFQQMMATNSPAIVKTLKQWGARYRGFIQKRFDTFSKGGGDWPALAPATIKRRRKGKRKGKHAIAILRDTSTMYRALSPTLGNPGQIEKVAGFFTVETGFGGPQAHPTGGKATISDIASFHNSGIPGRLPQRKIIVAPDERTRQLMADDAERNLSAEAKDTIG